MPKISVVVPVFNSENSLSCCINSILNQTYTDFELILVNDGSKDQSGKICDKFALRDSRVVVVHKENGGVSSARNAGIQRSRGSYIVFIDSDDYVESDYLQQLQSGKSDLTICGFVCKTSDGKFLYNIVQETEYFSCREKIDFPKLFLNNLLYSPYGKVFRKDIIDSHHLRFPQDISWGEDAMFIADYLKNVNTLTVLSYTGYIYVRYPGETSLATRVRADIVDDITQSRTYIAEQMKTTSPATYQKVKGICEEDIRCNCAYFVTCLIQGKKTFKEQRDTLNYFLSNIYVQQTISNREKYYSRSPSLCFSLAYKHIPTILVIYRWHLHLHKMHMRLSSSFHSFFESTKGKQK